jgi:hypothetical protein
VLLFSSSLNNNFPVLYRSTQTGTSASDFQATPEQIAQLSALLTQATQNSEAAGQPPGSSIYLFLALTMPVYNILRTFIDGYPHPS